MNDTCLHVKYPSFLSDCKETWIYVTEFRKVVKQKISWKNVQWEPSCSIRTDRQMDGRIGMMKLIVAFRNFAITPKKKLYEWMLISP